MSAGTSESKGPDLASGVAIDSIANFMFAPTEKSAANLREEYNRRGHIVVTGNTGIDALLYTGTYRIRAQSKDANTFRRSWAKITTASPARCRTCSSAIAISRTSSRFSASTN